jgi:PAS domain-containing protein
MVLAASTAIALNLFALRQLMERQDQRQAEVLAVTRAMALGSTLGNQMLGLHQQLGQWLEQARAGQLKAGQTVRVQEQLNQVLAEQARLRDALERSLAELGEPLQPISAETLEAYAEYRTDMLQAGARLGDTSTGASQASAAEAMRHYLHYVGHATELSAQLTQEVQGRLAGMAAQRRDFMFSAAMLALASLLLMSLLWLLTSLWLTRPLGVIAGALGQLNHAARWPQQSPAGEAALPLDLGTLSDVEALAHTRNTMVRELACAGSPRAHPGGAPADPAALDAERHRLKSLVRGMPGLVWLKDAEGIFLQCNRHFEDLLGHPEAELLGKTDYDFVPREQADMFRQNDLQAVLAAAR